MIEFLLNNANPSIKRRVKSEILHNLTPDKAALYQEQIMQEPNMQQIIAYQKENGWVGQWCHGSGKYSEQFGNQETATKYLAEKAIDKNTPVLKRAMDAYITVPLDDDCYHTGGKIIDEFKVTGHGMNLIRCACIARTGYDDLIDIAPQIQLSIDSFKRVLEVDSVLDISRPIQKGKKRIFNEFEKWPCRYHLDILAHSNSWKSEENVKIIADSVSKMMKTDCSELMNLIPASWVGYALGTLGGFPSQGLSIKCNGIYPFPIINQPEQPEFYNFEYIEWFARCGIVPYVPALREAVDEIVNSIDDNGICRTPISDDIFKRWGAYAGLQLEVDWKSKIRRDCDITFRALLILHYAQI